MKKKGLGKFIFGAGIGAGLGLLFAPKKGSETRTELYDKIKDLLDDVKQMDKEEVKKEFDKKLNEIKDELTDLDKEKALKIAKKKADELKVKSQELVDLAIDKGTPVLRDAAEELRLKTIDATKEILNKLENSGKNK